MKQVNDSIIQEMLSSKEITQDEFLTKEEKVSLMLYQQVVEAIQAYPNPAIKNDFSSIITEKIVHKKTRRYQIFLNFLIVFLTLFSFTAFIFFINSDMLYMVKTVLFQYKWIFLFTITMLTLIQLFDANRISIMNKRISL
ncbi:MAG: hypothetical protein WCP74_01660 [Sphingobacteriia bacterium]|jgi:hypothetical protein